MLPDCFVFEVSRIRAADTEKKTLKRLAQERRLMG